jgi:Na+-translocating ferredoxin:NAD+ oxidoreductase subunit B
MNPLAPPPSAGRPIPTAWIDESRCIGCTLCIQACPFDAIVGAARRMHTVVEPLCIGCKLCVAPCPVDCILMLDGSPERVWTREQVRAAGARVRARKQRLERERLQREARLGSRAREDGDSADPVVDPGSGVDRIAAIVKRAVRRARQRRSGAAR